MKTIKLLILLFPLIISTSAKAGILLEPYVGFQFGSLDQNNVSGTQSGQFNNNTMFYGSRLGYQSFGVMFGADFQLGTGSLEVDEPNSLASALGSSKESDIKVQKIGAFIGYNLPVMFRFWISHFFSAKAELTNNGGYFGDNADEYKGSETNIGLGWTGLPFLSVNLEYRMTSYDEFFNSSTSNTSSLTNKIEGNSFAVSVSFPFDI